MPEPDIEEEKHFEATCRFVIELGKMAHGYGPQTQRLESYLSRITKALGYEGIFLSTPSYVSFSFRRKDELWHRSHIVPMPGTGFNLAKLAKVGELVASVEAGNVTIEEATAALAEIDTMTPPFRKAMVALGYVLCGTGFAGFLQGSWWDIILSALLSIVVFLVVTRTERSSERLAQWVPFLCALIIGILSELLHSALPGTQPYLVTLSAIIYLIPGFSVSMGVIELMTKHVVSGLTNLMNGLICLVLLFAGAWVGISLVEALVPVQATQGVPVGHGITWLFAMMLASGLCIVFQTPLRDLAWALAGCAIAYAGIVAGGALFANNLGNLLGTAGAILFANIWSDRTNRPASIVMIPAVVFLVSGSIGFRGLVAMSYGNTALGLQQFFHMFVVASTIALGLVVGNTLYRPRISL
jgi:uncharacterized membrane protein YjjP (DUF1212 family)